MQYALISLHKHLTCLRGFALAHSINDKYVNMLRWRSNMPIHPAETYRQNISINLYFMWPFSHERVCFLSVLFPRHEKKLVFIHTCFFGLQALQNRICLQTEYIYIYMCMCVHMYIHVCVHTPSGLYTKRTIHKTKATHRHSRWASPAISSRGKKVWEFSKKNSWVALGNFGPNRSLFGQVVEVVRLICSHKILINGPHNQLTEHGSPYKAYPHAGFPSIPMVGVAPLFRLVVRRVRTDGQGE